LSFREYVKFRNEHYYVIGRLIKSILPVVGSILSVLGFVFSSVFIVSQPQTPHLQTNFAESRMQSNTNGLFSHFFDNHFVEQALYALVNL